jgi:hypothetical protein
MDLAFTASWDHEGRAQARGTDDRRPGSRPRRLRFHPLECPDHHDAPIETADEHHEPGQGVISGFADSCSGLMEHVHVKVLLYRGPRLVSSETIRSGAGFRFSVVPGSYRVMADHRSVRVTVRAGRTATASLLSVCL